MLHEKEVKLKNGDTLKILVSLYVDHMKDEFYWNSHTLIRHKGKRTFISHKGECDEIDVNAAILSVKQELWEKIKP